MTKGLVIREETRRRLDSAMRRYGPKRNETLDEVEARLERQAVATALVETIAEMLRHPGRKYDDLTDYARQIATVLLAEFKIERGK